MGNLFIRSFFSSSAWMRRFSPLLAGAGLLGGCNLGSFTTTQTVELDGREIVAFLVRGAILNPINNVVNQGVDRIVDFIVDDNDGE